MLHKAAHTVHAIICRAALQPHAHALMAGLQSAYAVSINMPA